MTFAAEAFKASDPTVVDTRNEPAPKTNTGVLVTYLFEDDPKEWKRNAVVINGTVLQFLLDRAANHRPVIVLNSLPLTEADVERIRRGQNTQWYVTVFDFTNCL